MLNSEPLSPPVRWDLFTDEEQRAMQQLMDSGFYSELAAHPILDVSPAKEAEIARIQAHFSPSVVGYESKVKKKLDKLVADGKVNLDDPSVESEWHHKLLVERSEWEKKQSEVSVKAQKKAEEAVEAEEVKKRGPGRPPKVVKEEVKEE